MRRIVKVYGLQPVKGTAFRPYVNYLEMNSALAAEGTIAGRKRQRTLQPDGGF